MEPPASAKRQRVRLTSWDIFLLIEDGKYGDALEAVHALEGTADDWDPDYPDTPLFRLCAADDGKKTGQSALRFPLIKACLSKGAPVCHWPEDPLHEDWFWNPLSNAMSKADIDVLRYVFDCGVAMRGQKAANLIAHTEAYIEDVRRNGPSWIYSDDYFRGPEYIADLVRIEELFRTTRARQNWRALRAKAGAVGKLALFVRLLYDSAQYRPGGRGFERCRDEFEALRAHTDIA